MNKAIRRSEFEEAANEVHLCQPTEIDGSELLLANGANEGHKVLRPIQDQIKGFRDAKLRLDAADDASTLGEGNKHG
ncbi:hypothetical protein BHE74_00007338 [Ensete ventricosum]|nr:hypothetical protein BHE74_00007338 [Ensete ventricosum]